MDGRNSFPPGMRRIVVLLGGDSAEREISLASGRAVIAALTERGHVVASLDPLETPVPQFAWTAGDVALLALHGRYGEDGHVQTQLETLGIPYTGAGPEASRVAFSKSSAKLEFLRHEVPTPAHVTIHQSNSIGRLRRLAEAVGYPLVVKPDQQGSSLGVSLVERPYQLAAAVAHALSFGSLGLIEKAIRGTEWTVGFLDSQALPPICITTPHPFFDFDAKYADEQTRYDFDGPLPAPRRDRVVRAAQQACRSVGVVGLSRVDLRVDESGDPWVLEINTVPGLTDHSLVPKAAARIGWSLGELCERMILSGLAQFATCQSQSGLHNRTTAEPLRRAG
jgi:D-alanine-D-alanine ligase